MTGVRADSSLKMLPQRASVHITNLRSEEPGGQGDFGIICQFEFVNAGGKKPMGDGEGGRAKETEGGEQQENVVLSHLSVSRVHHTLVTGFMQLCKEVFREFRAVYFSF